MNDIYEKTAQKQQIRMNVFFLNDIQQLFHELNGSLVKLQ